MPGVLKRLGYSAFREGQDKIVTHIMAGQDTLGILPTATGKTLAFVAPTLALGWRTLVFSPLISLMHDQQQALARKGVRVGNITSHNPQMNVEFMRQWRAGDLELLFVAPERLKNEEFLQTMRAVPPDMTVVDEAHCFPGDYMVATEFGNRTLRDLHLSRLAGHPLPRVWSRNTGGFIELKPVTMSWQHDATGKRLIRVHVRGKGAVDCTDDHVWFTKDGESEAGCLQAGTLVHCKAFGGQELRGLNPDQLQLVIGSYLGDGGLGCTGSDTNSYRIAWTHGWAQREYCQWKSELLGGSWTPVAENGYSGKPAMRGRTAVFQLPGPIHKGGRWLKKSAPSWMLDQMDARAVAIWFMDDGSYQSGAAILHMQDFSEEGVDALRDVLLRRFGIVTKRLNAKGWIISIGVEETKKFIKLVRPFMRPEFMYKIGLTTADFNSSEKWDAGFSTALYPVERVEALANVPEFLYDIEVAGNNNFFVFSKVAGAARTTLSYDTNHAVLVHNCLSSWSDTFRHAYCVIGDFITEFQPKVVAALTATCPPQVERDIRRVLCMEHAAKALHYPRRTNLDLRSLPGEGTLPIVPFLERRPGPSLVYCVSKKATEQTASELGKYLGQEVGFYHGGLKKSLRSHTQDRFMHGDLDIVCATNAFGMGVDKSNLRLIVHRDIAGSAEAQMQECGRAGRDGNYSLCQTFFSNSSVNTHRFLINMSSPSFDDVEKVYKALQKLSDRSGLVTAGDDAIAKAAYMNGSWSLPAIYQILSGAQVINKVKDKEKICSVRLRNRIDDPKLMALLDILQIRGDPGDDGYTDISMPLLADELDVSPTTVSKRLNDWAKAGVVEYVPPDRSRPVQLLGDIKQVDSARVDSLRQISFAKLEQTIVYGRDIPDGEKHSYLETCMGITAAQSGV